MFYTIYKITNRIDGKEYTGKHQTKDLNDSYMGSGKLLKPAINKHGIENFDKEILFVFDNEDEMNLKEAELVTEEYCNSKNTYNLCPGGNGGFGFINGTMKEHMNQLKSKIQKDKPKSYYQNLGLKASKVSSERMMALHKEGKISAPDWLGRKHSEETKQKMRKSKNVGENNPQYGTCWVTNGKESKRIIIEDFDLWQKKGYRKGRVML